jgi:hypothetical protein
MGRAENLITPYRTTFIKFHCIKLAKKKEKRKKKTNHVNEAHFPDKNFLRIFQCGIFLIIICVRGLGMTNQISHCTST